MIPGLCLARPRNARWGTWPARIPRNAHERQVLRKHVRRRGDWGDRIEVQGTVNGNLSEDSLFCDAAAGDFTIDAISPCCAESNPTCQLIGAWGSGCDTPVETISWRSIKAMFR